MTTQNYLQIQNNIVTNVIVWDGDVTTWTPPEDSTMLIQAITPAKVWVGQTEPPNIVYALEEIVGAGAIGFTWDGNVLTTNEPNPT